MTRLQPVSGIAYAPLIAASPGEVLRLLGDDRASGNLIVRIVKLRFFEERKQTSLPSEIAAKIPNNNR